MSKEWLPAKSELEEGTRGLLLEDVHDESKAIAAKLVPRDARLEPLITPIYNSSVYRIDSVNGYLDILKNGGYIYGRLGNPTCEAAECAINALEGGAGTMIFSSGMAAITTALTCFLKAGDHVICQNPLYSGTHKFLTKYLTNFNIDVTWVSAGCSVDDYRKHLRPNTRVLYGETPANPEISILDLEEFGLLGRSLPDVITMVDSTYASPYLQQPIKFGIDVVLHSATKYLGGHCDIIGGSLSTRTLEHWQKLNVYRTTLGNSMSPYDAFLLLRGVKTLAVRMEQHSKNAQKIAEFLEKSDKVAKVLYPGLLSHPGHAIAKKQMKLFSGMVAFDLKGGMEAAKTVIQGLHLIELMVSLGGTETLIEHAASMTHGPMVMSDAERKEAGITEGLIRLSVGLENAEDLIKDLAQALEQI